MLTITLLISLAIYFDLFQSLPHIMFAYKRFREMATIEDDLKRTAALLDALFAIRFTARDGIRTFCGIISL